MSEASPSVPSGGNKSPLPMILIAVVVVAAMGAGGVYWFLSSQTEQANTVESNNKRAEILLAELLDAVADYSFFYGGYPAGLNNLFQVMGPGAAEAEPNCESAFLLDQIAAEMDSGTEDDGHINYSARGYVVSYTPGAPIKRSRKDCPQPVEKFTMTLRPEKFGATGARSFFVNEDGKVHYTDEDRSANSDDAVLLELEEVVAAAPGAPRELRTKHYSSVHLWGEMNIWPQHVLNHDTDITSVAFSPDGRLLAAAGTGSKVSVWDLRTGRGQFTLEGSAPVAFSRDGRTLATGAPEGLALWNPRTGELLEKLSEIDTDEPTPARIIAFGPKKGQLAVSFVSGGVTIYKNNEPDDVIQTANLEGLPDEPIGPIAFHPNGRQLVIGVGEVFALRNLDPAETVRIMKRFFTVNSLAFSGGGTWLAVSTESDDDGSIDIWSTKSNRFREPMAKFGGKDATEIPQWVTFHPDGRTIAAVILQPGSGGSGADFKHMIGIWEVSSGKTLQSISTGTINSVAFSRDGRLLAAAGENGDVKIWRVGPR